MNNNKRKYDDYLTNEGSDNVNASDTKVSKSNDATTLNSTAEEVEDVERSIADALKLIEDSSGSKALQNLVLRSQLGTESRLSPAEQQKLREILDEKGIDVTNIKRFPAHSPLDGFDLRNSLNFDIYTDTFMSTNLIIGVPILMISILIIILIYLAIKRCYIFYIKIYNL